MRYKLTNKLKQIIILDDGKKIDPVSFLLVDAITLQIKNLEKSGFISVKKFDEQF